MKDSTKGGGATITVLNLHRRPAGPKRISPALRAQARGRTRPNDGVHVLPKDCMLVIEDAVGPGGRPMKELSFTIGEGAKMRVRTFQLAASNVRHE